MPTLLKREGFRFFIDARGVFEAPHVYVVESVKGIELKVWLEKLSVEYAFNTGPKDRRRVIEIIFEHRLDFLAAWRGCLPLGRPNNEIKRKKNIAKLSFKADMMGLHLTDARVLSLPLSWFPKLQNAQTKDLYSYTISPTGHGIYWPKVDEDIFVEQLFS